MKIESKHPFWDLLLTSVEEITPKNQSTVSQKPRFLRKNFFTLTKLRTFIYHQTENRNFRYIKLE